MNFEGPKASVLLARILSVPLFIALAFFFAVCGSAISLQAQLSPESDQLLHRMYASSDFEVKYFGPARWLDDGAFYTTVEPSSAVKNAQDIVRYETASGKREVFVSAAKLIPSGNKAPLAFENYTWSKDKLRLLLYTNSAQVWRQHTRGDYWVLDLQSGVLRKLGGDAPASSLMFAKFSPDGSRVAYVRANNIYVEEISTGRITQLTHDGSQTIINGTSDWVYEEELDIRDAFRWSPDGRRIAYWQFDTSGVGIFKLLYNLGAPKEIVTGFPYPGLGVYPTVLNIPYPIPGTTNSAVRAGVVSVDGGDTTVDASPRRPAGKLHCAPRVGRKFRRTRHRAFESPAKYQRRVARRCRHRRGAPDFSRPGCGLGGRDGRNPLGPQCAGLFVVERARRLAPRLSCLARRKTCAADHSRRLRCNRTLRRGRKSRLALFHRFSGKCHAALSLPRAAGWFAKRRSASVPPLHPELIVTTCLPTPTGLFTFIRARTSHR